jgi:hypothetical protein
MAGNYNSTSKGMEGEGYNHILSAFKREKLLPMVKTSTSDDDSSVKKMMAEDDQLTHIMVHLSPAHTPTHMLTSTAKMGCWLHRSTASAAVMYIAPFCGVVLTC